MWLGGSVRLLMATVTKTKTLYLNIHNTIRHNTSQYVTIRHNTSQYVTIRYNTSQYVTIHKTESNSISDQNYHGSQGQHGETCFCACACPRLPSRQVKLCSFDVVMLGAFYEFIQMRTMSMISMKRSFTRKIYIDDIMCTCFCWSTISRSSLRRQGTGIRFCIVLHSAAPGAGEAANSRGLQNGYPWLLPWVRQSL